MVPWPLCAPLYSVLRAGGGWGGGSNEPPPTFVEPSFSLDCRRASTQPPLLAFVLHPRPPRPRIPSGRLWPPAQFPGWLGGRGRGLDAATGEWQERGCRSCLRHALAGTTFRTASHSGLGKAGSHRPSAHPSFTEIFRWEGREHSRPLHSLGRKCV